MNEQTPYETPALGAPPPRSPGIERKKRFWLRAIWGSAALFLGAPMVGLFVTVSGMRKAFASMGNDGIADPAALSEHIGQVLTATAFGLLFSLPGLVLLIIAVIRYFSCRANPKPSAR